MDNQPQPIQEGVLYDISRDQPDVERALPDIPDAQVLDAPDEPDAQTIQARLDQALARQAELEVAAQQAAQARQVALQEAQLAAQAAQQAARSVQQMQQRAQRTQQEHQAALRAAIMNPEQARVAAEQARVAAQQAQEAERKAQELRVYNAEMNRLHAIFSRQKARLVVRETTLRFTLTRYSTMHREVANTLQAIHRHYNPLLSPNGLPGDVAMYKPHVQPPSADTCNKCVAAALAVGMPLMHLCVSFAAWWHSGGSSGNPPRDNVAYAWNIPVYSVVFIVFVLFTVPFNSHFRASYYNEWNRLIWVMAKGYQLAIVVYLYNPWWSMTPQIHTMFLVLLWTDLITLEWMTSNPEDQLLRQWRDDYDRRQRDLHMIWYDVSSWNEENSYEESRIIEQFEENVQVQLRELRNAEYAAERRRQEERRVERLRNGDF